MDKQRHYLPLHPPTRTALTIGAAVMSASILAIDTTLVALLWWLIDEPALRYFSVICITGFAVQLLTRLIGLYRAQAKHADRWHSDPEYRNHCHLEAVNGLVPTTQPPTPPLSPESVTAIWAAALAVAITFGVAATATVEGETTWAATTAVWAAVPVLAVMWVGYHHLRRANEHQRWQRTTRPMPPIDDNTPAPPPKDRPLTWPSDEWEQVLADYINTTTRWHLARARVHVGTGSLQRVQEAEALMCEQITALTNPIVDDSEHPHGLVPAMANDHWPEVPGPATEREIRAQVHRSACAQLAHYLAQATEHHHQPEGARQR